ncbi:response regulator [Hoeflea sp. WL0058]|uniref:histidine kinase n=1 Tax=Flavimaribacter sediminis TaxID=2865987 RepID=A0AAE2ZM26_9HYPH|nr:HWE histidine kinase domain-containing protein [Flavimaribacter sediminis]MBW8637107.1 response regulator [Flavimaribacter sediminis]
MPIAIYWGSELRLLYNDAWSNIPGPRHPSALGAPAREVWSDIWHVIEPQFAELIRTGEGVYVEDQMLPMQRYGVLEETYWNYSFTAIRGEDGRIVGVFNGGSETTDKVLAQRQTSFLLRFDENLRARDDPESARRFAVEFLGEHLKVAQMGFCEFDSKNRDLPVVETWHDSSDGSAANITGLEKIYPSEADRLANGVPLRIDRMDDDSAPERLREIFTSAGINAAVAAPWIDQGRLVSVLYAHSREPRSWTRYEMATIAEVLRRTWVWIEQRRARERERIMIREIDHRARNVLAVTKSVIHLTQAETIEEFRAKIEDRIASLSRSHSLLSSESWSDIDLATILRNELEPYRESDLAVIEMDGPRVDLSAQMTQSLALIFHELTTNAAKYGPLSESGGRLSIRWRMDDGLLELQWREHVIAGKSAPSVPKGGFGSKLMNQIVLQQLDGMLERRMESDGLFCRIALPLADGLRVEQPVSDQDVPLAEPSQGVLIVEDEALIAMDIEMMIEDLGHGVAATANSVAAALEAIDRHLPSLAVVDLNLGGESSEPVIASLGAKGVPIIVASGYSDFETPEGIEAPVTKLMKPVSRELLEQAIDKVGKSLK